MASSRREIACSSERSDRSQRQAFQGRRGAAFLADAKKPFFSGGDFFFAAAAFFFFSRKPAGYWPSIVVASFSRRALVASSFSFFSASYLGTTICFPSGSRGRSGSSYLFFVFQAPFSRSDCGLFRARFL